MFNSSGQETTTAGTTEHPGFRGDIDKAWGSLGLICGAFTIVGNVLVFTVLAKLRKRSLSDCAFLNLAVIDTISGMAAIAGSWFLIDDRTWVLQEYTLWYDITCYAAGMSWNAASLTTPLLVSIVSIGRLAAVYLPLKYDKIFIPPVVYAMLTYCWLHGIVASTLSLWGDSGEGKYTLWRAWGFCDQSISTAYINDKISQTLYLIFFTLPMMLTCTCIVVCNLCVMVRILAMKLTEPPEKELTRRSTVAEPPAQVLRQHVQRISRRISTMSSLRYSKSSGPNNNSVPYHNNNNNSTIEESSFTYGGNNSDGHYRHFEIMSVNENTALTGQMKPGARPSSIVRDLPSCGSLTSSTCLSEAKPRKHSQMSRKKTMQKIRRAKRENRAILMTFLVSITYLICYMEIINFYILASFTDSPSGLISKLFGSNPSKTAETYGNLWYYYSLFAAAATNVLLHFLFNRVVRKGVAMMHGDKNVNSSATGFTQGMRS